MSRYGPWNLLCKNRSGVIPMFFTAAAANDEASIAKTVVTIPFSVKSKQKHHYVPPHNDAGAVGNDDADAISL